MKEVIWQWIILTLTVALVTYLFVEINVDSIVTLIIVGTALTIFHLILKPIVSLITLPINLITLGLFSVLINAVVFWLLSVLIIGFSITNVIAALAGSVFISVINWIGSKLFGY